MKKLIMVAVMVVLFAGAVGVGVHILNKEARAEQLHRIKVWDENDQGVAGIYCIIWVLDHLEGEMEVWNFYDGVTDANGCFDVQDDPPSYATYWTAWVDVDDLEENGWVLAPGQPFFESVDYQQDGTLWIFNCVPDI